MAKPKSPESSNLSTISAHALDAKKLILASTSITRIKILQNAGLTFTSQTAGIDEEAEQNLRKHHSAANLAQELAKLKAQSLSNQEDLILGADQTLDLEGHIYHKPKNKDEAFLQLKALRGKTHTLTSAVAISHQGQLIWHYSEQAHLTMRIFSDQFIEDYISKNQKEILTSVGCYQLEAQGIQLFNNIAGDYFTILGLPLLPCLAFLRSIGFTRS